MKPTLDVIKRQQPVFTSRDRENSLKDIQTKITSLFDSGDSIQATKIKDTILLILEKTTNGNIDQFNPQSLDEKYDKSVFEEFKRSPDMMNKIKQICEVEPVTIAGLSYFQTMQNNVTQLKYTKMAQDLISWLHLKNQKYQLEYIKLFTTNIITGENSEQSINTLLYIIDQLTANPQIKFNDLKFDNTHHKLIIKLINNSNFQNSLKEICKADPESNSWNFFLRYKDNQLKYSKSASELKQWLTKIKPQTQISAFTGASATTISEGNTMDPLEQERIKNHQKYLSYIQDELKKFTTDDKGSYTLTTNEQKLFNDIMDAFYTNLPAYNPNLGQLEDSSSYRNRILAPFINELNTLFRPNEKPEYDVQEIDSMPTNKKDFDKSGADILLHDGKAYYCDKNNNVKIINNLEPNVAVTITGIKNYLDNLYNSKTEEFKELINNGLCLPKIRHTLYDLATHGKDLDFSLIQCLNGGTVDERSLHTVFSKIGYKLATDKTPLEFFHIPIQFVLLINIQLIKDENAPEDAPDTNIYNIKVNKREFDEFEKNKDNANIFLTQIFEKYQTLSISTEYSSGRNIPFGKN